VFQTRNAWGRAHPAFSATGSRYPGDRSVTGGKGKARMLEVFGKREGTRGEPAPRPYQHQRMGPGWKKEGLGGKRGGRYGGQNRTFSTRPLHEPIEKAAKRGGGDSLEKKQGESILRWVTTKERRPRNSLTPSENKNKESQPFQNSRQRGTESRADPDGRHSFWRKKLLQRQI